MEYPAVRVTVDKQYDKESLLEFLDDRDPEYDFGYDRIIQWHPALESYRGKPKEEQRKAIDSYVDGFYDEHLGELEASARVIQAMWNEMSAAYFQEVKRLFGPLGFYEVKTITVSPSLALCNDIKDDFTGFHVWYRLSENPEEIKRLLAHEILHFYYYTYVRSKGFHLLADQWDLAEIFNRVILGLPQFLDIIKLADNGYEQHDRHMPYYENLWKKSSSLDAYLQRTNAEGLIDPES